MKLLYSLILLATLSQAKSIEAYHNDFKQLSVSQLETLTDAFVYGKQHNLQWSLCSIAWQESNAGQIQVSMIGNDYGICQINIKSYLSRHNIRDTKWNRAKYATNLILNPKLNYQAAVDELRYWESKKQPWQSYRSVWASYNAGHTGNYKYASEIAKRIQVLKIYFSDI